MIKCTYCNEDAVYFIKPYGPGCQPGQPPGFSCEKHLKNLEEYVAIEFGSFKTQRIDGQTDLILPTDEQVERAAQAIAQSRGFEIVDQGDGDWLAFAQSPFDPAGEGHYLQPSDFQSPAREFLVILLNKDKILARELTELAKQGVTTPEDAEIARKYLDGE